MKSQVHLTRPAVGFFLLLGAPLLATALIPQAARAQQAPDVAKPPITLDELPQLLGDPTVVTFSGTHVLVKEVKAALLDAAGLPQSQADQLDDPSLKTVSVNWVEIPFWKAAQQMEDLTGAHWSGMRGFALRRAPNSKTPNMGGLNVPELASLMVGMGETGDLNGISVFENPYLKLIATSISSSRQASHALNGADEDEAPGLTSTLSLGVYPDPKLKIDSAKVTDVKAQTAEGKVLEVPKTDAMDVFSAVMANAREKAVLVSLVRVQLPSGLQPGTVLKSISGIAHLNIAVGQDAWKISDLLAQPDDTYTSAGITLSIGKARMEDGVLKLRLAVKSAGKGLDAMTNMRLIGTVKISDGKGNSLDQDMAHSNFSLSADAGQEIGADVIFKARQGAIEGPISVNWTLPSPTRPLDVPFELHDVKIP